MKVFLRDPIHYINLALENKSIIIIIIVGWKSLYFVLSNKALMVVQDVTKDVIVYKSVIC